MLEARELRIDNYAIDVKGRVFQLIKAEDLCRIEEDPSKYKGIPLTEEWLIRFGFENGKLQIPNADIDWAIMMENDEIVLNYANHHYTLCKGVGIKYVHQLQNLFYSLCGEELTDKQQ